MQDEFLTRTAITVASTVVVEPIKHIMNTWLKPKLEEIKKKKEIDEKLEKYTFEIFLEYLNRTYSDQNNINIIALGLQQVTLESTYIPLTINSVERKEKITLDSYNETFAAKYKKIVIEDTAGMGKSTLMKKLFISAIQQNVGIPIFIELRHLTKENDILDTILENINPLQGTHDKEFILEVINRGDFIFFFDGYDEIPFQHKEHVTRHIKRFISKASNNIFFLTSRLDDSLSSFGEFQKFEIEDLSREEAFSLIKKYDNITQLNLAPSIIKQIKENINGERFSELNSFLGNPLLVSFLYLTFKHKRDIPSLKIDFYRKVYDALFELHDLSKESFKREKYSGLSSVNLQKILMKLGFLCLRENNNDYDKNKILKLISQAKNSPYFNDIQEDLILKDLLETVPLFTTIGLGFKWSHKSFMEYFAAYFIDNQENREKILNDINNSANHTIYLNMLDFYYDIDRQLFDKVFVYPIIKQFIAFITASGIDPYVEKEKLMYLEMFFNKLFIIDYDESSLKALKTNKKDMKWKEKERVLIEHYFKHDPSIKTYNLVRSIEGTRRNAYQFTKNNKTDNIIGLLKRKRSSLVKSLYRAEPFTLKENSTTNIYTWEDLDLKKLSNEEINDKVLTVTNTFGLTRGESLSRLRGMHLIDYFEAIKYKKLIEEEMSIKEDDLFTNL
ncbi:NACHT domain-containing protein [Priestia aryabhattai]|uniref:NACHT domain-containing protein n=1 Tax=Priestia aryabhattai TaxID=412384 RepID=UPI003C880B0B